MRTRSRAPMTDTVYTHKPAALRLHGSRVFARLRLAPGSEHGAVGMCAVDTHEFLKNAAPAAQTLQLGVHAHPQLSRDFLAQQCQAIAMAPEALGEAPVTTVVYAYKQLRSGQEGTAGGLLTAVYTYKQSPAPGTPWPTPTRGHRPPPTVYTHKHPHRTPPRAGFGAFGPLKTGERP